MKLEQSFTVTAPIERVWALLIDVEQIAPCLPGADITGQGEDGSYQGTFKVKLGPTTANYNGGLKLESLDEASRTAMMSAKGTDKRGQGGATATITSSMVQQGDETTVDVLTDFAITGRLASFGRSGMIGDISKRLMRDFAQCLQAKLEYEQQHGAAAAEEAAPPPAETAPAGVAPAPEQVSTGSAAEDAPAPQQAPPAVAPEGQLDLRADEEPAARTESIAPPPLATPPTGPAPPRAKPVNAVSLFLSVLWERIRRLFSRSKS